MLQSLSHDIENEKYFNKFKNQGNSFEQKIEKVVFSYMNFLGCGQSRYNSSKHLMDQLEKRILQIDIKKRFKVFASR